MQLIDSFFFRRELSIIKNEKIKQVVLASKSSGPIVAIDTLNNLPPNYKSITFFRLLWLFKQQEIQHSDFELFYQTYRDRWELEEKRLASEYATADVFIWSMPILGFIGTVIGISLAVGNFSSFLNVSGNDIELGMIKERLSEVASGLAFAFDTTLLGLASSLLGMLGTSFTGSQENEYMTRLKALSLDVIIKK